jgi:tyrosyl-tRNA synthetase
MAKVSTDKKLIEKFLTRGVEKVYPTTNALREVLMSGKRLRVYQGFDPTGPHLHVGHAMGIRALRILQQLGHEVIFLVGDFTAKVGDPDKDVARKILTDAEIEENMKGWKKQAAQLIDFDGENPVLFRKNSEWLSKLNLEDLIHLMSKSTLQQMIERDLFDRRIKNGDPIGMHEFLYPLMQGFDSVAMETDMQIGGNDQTFNMLVCRQLVKNYLNKEMFVRTNKMMNAPDGITMSKTKGNGINLADTATDMYGKAMSYADEEIINGLELLTDVEEGTISEIRAGILAGENPINFKKLMAYEIVKAIRGEGEAKAAQEHFEKTVQNKEVSDEDMIEVNFSDLGIPKSGMDVFSILKSPKIVGKEVSGSDIRRMIEQGGVQINGEVITDLRHPLNLVSGMVVKFGKRKFFKIIL